LKAILGREKSSTPNICNGSLSLMKVCDYGNHLGKGFIIGVMAGMIALTEAVAIGKIGKIWVNNVRRDIPKHQRNFTTFHRKQLVDAKRSAENCQREVRLKVSRSIKWMHTAGIRTQKLASDMLLFWKRIDKEMRGGQENY
ncbi:hypothetical protein S83_070188, partial [Arachis hypogaea]